MPGVRPVKVAGDPETLVVVVPLGKVAVGPYSIMYAPEAVPPEKVISAVVWPVPVPLTEVGASQATGAAVVLKVPCGLLPLVTPFGQVVLTTKVYAVPGVKPLKVAGEPLTVAVVVPAGKVEVGPYSIT